MASHLWVEGLTFYGSSGFTVRWKEKELSGSHELYLLGLVIKGLWESRVLPFDMRHFRQISHRLMLMDDCLASITPLWFLSLWQQEALTERSGEKIEELFPGEFLPCFNPQIRAPCWLSPRAGISLSLWGVVLFCGINKAIVSPFVTSFLLYGIH